MLALPSQQELCRILRYDAQSGILYWRHRDDRLRNWNVLYADKPAGALDKSGYIHINISGKFYQAHRLIWRMVTGEDPQGEIDHRNGRRNCNVWTNLRPATAQQNRMNMRKRGPWPKGVYFYKRDGTFRAQIKKNGKHRYLGLHDTPDSAHQAYVNAANDMFGEFACHNR